VCGNTYTKSQCIDYRYEDLAPPPFELTLGSLRGQFAQETITEQVLYSCALSPGILTPLRMITSQPEIVDYRIYLHEKTDNPNTCSFDPNVPATALPLDRPAQFPLTEIESSQLRTGLMLVPNSSQGFVIRVEATNRCGRKTTKQLCVKILPPPDPATANFTITNHTSTFASTPNLGSVPSSTVYDCAASKLDFQLGSVTGNEPGKQFTWKLEAIPADNACAINGSPTLIGSGDETNLPPTQSLSSYVTPGQKYLVKLTVQNACNTESSQWVCLDVKPTPDDVVADFTITPEKGTWPVAYLCGNIPFVDNSTNAIAPQWKLEISEASDATCNFVASPPVFAHQAYQTGTANIADLKAYTSNALQGGKYYRVKYLLKDVCTPEQETTKCMRVENGVTPVAGLKVQVASGSYINLSTDINAPTSSCFTQVPNILENSNTTISTFDLKIETLAACSTGANVNVIHQTTSEPFDPTKFGLRQARLNETPPMNTRFSFIFGQDRCYKITYKVFNECGASEDFIGYLRTNETDCRISSKINALNASALTAYPNPTSGLVDFQISLPAAQTVSLSVVDLNGRVVRQVLENEMLPEGISNVSTNLENLPAGIYLYRLNGDTFLQGRLIKQ